MSIEQRVHEAMIAKGKMLVLAESCTGGRIASRLTMLAGASRYFLGSLVVYSNELKRKMLGVSEQTLETFGAVSREVVEEMVAGLMEVADGDYGIAVTGIAGPDGGTIDKPVGTVWCAIMKRGEDPLVWKYQGSGSREQIIDGTVDEVLGKLLASVRV